MNLARYLEERRLRVEDFLKNHFREEDPRLGRFFEAARYSLMAGGKRVRPVLLLAAYEAVKSEGDAPYEAALRVGAAIEMIHTYSLIHDDLPAMDNDDLRRGRPTSHKVFGEAMAILAGDALLTEAFVVISRSEGVPPAVLIDILGDIAQAAGAEGMAGGQALDLASEGKRITPEDLEFLHRHKTGALMEVSVTSGAKLGGADREALRALKDYGQKVGLSFQIADDILDVEAGSQELGKTAGKDLLHEKATYPALIGMERSKRLAEELTEEAVTALAGFDARADPLREIARYIVSRRN